MDFALYRVFLTKREQSDFFERDVGSDENSRERWLREVFSEQIQFNIRKNAYFFVPLAVKSGTHTISGRIGRQRTIHEAAPPEEGLADTEREQWQAALIVIDPRTHEDGQKIAIQKAFDVGQPNIILGRLFDSINDREPPEPYQATINSITDAQSFWEFVAEHEGAVTSVVFDVAMPNMFGGADNFEEEMRALRDQNKAQRAKIQIGSKDGLDLDKGGVKEIVDYTVKGGGSVKARAKGGDSYDTKKKAQTVEITHLDQNKEQLSLTDIVKSVVDAIFRS